MLFPGREDDDPFSGAPAGARPEVGSRKAKPGLRDPSSIRLEEFANRRDRGGLWAPGPSKSFSDRAMRRRCAARAKVVVPVASG